MANTFLRVRAPIPTEPQDPAASPPPAPPDSILLDRYGYLSRRLNSTTAEGITADGNRIQVTFWVTTPPKVSCFTVYSPDLNLSPSSFSGLPTVIYSTADLVLLRIPILRRDPDDNLHDGDRFHYFVYQASASATTTDDNRRPSLEMLPIPREFKFSDNAIVLLPCRAQDMFYVAALDRIVDLKNNGKRFDLHIYSSRTGAWSTQNQFVDAVDYLNYSYPNVAITIGGELGSVGWVDLWRGMLVCDLLHDDDRTLRYVPLPAPLVPNKPLKGYPMCFRDVVVVGDCVKFFEMSYQYQHGRPAGSAGLVAASKKMRISDISSAGKNNNDVWEDDCSFKFSDIPVDSPEFIARLLPHLKQGENTKQPNLMRLCYAGYPALSLQDDDVVYVMHTPDPDEDKALVIALDMREKTIRGVADFGSGRPLGYTFTYLQSGISKHLNIWSDPPPANSVALSVLFWTNIVNIN